jgi:hypothetical protein
MIYENTAVLIVPKKNEILMFSVWKDKSEEDPPS